MNILKYPCAILSPTAVALGRFDGVHTAHKAVITAAGESSPDLEGTVFTFSDNPNKASSLLLTTEEEKNELIESCKIKNLVYAAFNTLRNLSAEEFVEKVLYRDLNARAVFCGFNYRFGKGACADVNTLRTLCEERGIRLTIIDEVTKENHIVSSTSIRNLLSDGNIEKANILLGWQYSLHGEIVHGNAIGRTIDTPTLNLKVNEEKFLPRYGVYASYAHIEGKTYKSVTNIGLKPTVGSASPTVETYLLDGNGDFYNKDCTIELTAFIRPEKRFLSLDDLKSAISGDIEKTRQLL